MLLFGIDLNAAENGIFLPATVHASAHTNAYYDAVNEALRGAGSAHEVVGILDQIRTGLLSGRFPK